MMVVDRHLLVTLAPFRRVCLLTRGTSRGTYLRGDWPVDSCQDRCLERCHRIGYRCTVSAVEAVFHESCNGDRHAIGWVLALLWQVTGHLYWRKSPAQPAYKQLIKHPMRRCWGRNPVWWGRPGRGIGPWPGW
jgi:hypothetical protein